MKTLRTFTRVLSVGLGLGILVLFFFPFVTFNVDPTLKVTGAELCFGSKLPFGDTTVQLAKSLYFTFAFVLIALGALFSGLSFKFKGSAYAAPAFNLVAAITFTVFTVTAGQNYVDFRKINTVYENFTRDLISYRLWFYIAYGLVLAALIVSVLALLVADRVDVMESKGTRKPILGRVIGFLREYKSEIKKIVWPGPRAVVKNTVIVLIMCLMIGAFIWLADLLFGEGFLLLFK